MLARPTTRSWPPRVARRLILGPLPSAPPICLPAWLSAPTVLFRAIPPPTGCSASSCRSLTPLPARSPVVSSHRQSQAQFEFASLDHKPFFARTLRRLQPELHHPSGDQTRSGSDQLGNLLVTNNRPPIRFSSPIPTPPTSNGSTAPLSALAGLGGHHGEKLVLKASRLGQTRGQTWPCIFQFFKAIFVIHCLLSDSLATGCCPSRFSGCGQHSMPFSTAISLGTKPPPPKRPCSWKACKE